MGMKVNASRGNIRVEGGYLFVRSCTLDKQMTLPKSPQEQPQRKSQWVAEMWLVGGEEDRDLIFSGPHNGPLAIWRVNYGVAAGRDPLEDAYSMIRAGTKNDRDWVIDEVVGTV